jgi:uncharacterized protein (UPF0297 family)
MSSHTDLESQLRRTEKPSAADDVIQISITDLEMIEQTIDEPAPKKPSKEDELRGTIKEIYTALCEKGYDPARQIAGYILSEDPVYITNWKNARGLMARVNRDELLVEIIKNYLKSLEK